jgi:hypothetical protein
MRLSIIFILLMICAGARGQSDFTISRTNGSTGLKICHGENVAFTANVTASTYQWRINGSGVTSDIGTQPQVFVRNSWAYNPGVTVECWALVNNVWKYSNVLTTQTCVPPQPPAFTVGIAILPDRNPKVYCRGESVTFQANTSHSASAYNWYRNGASVGSGSSYTPPVGLLNTGDVIRVEAFAANPGSVSNPSATSTLPGNIFTIRENVSASPISCNVCGVVNEAGQRCQGGGTTPMFSSISNGDTFIWTITDNNPAVDNSISSSGIVTWNPNFTGTATIRITATGCSTATATKDIVVSAGSPIQITPVGPITIGEGLPEGIRWTTPESGSFQWLLDGQPVVASETVPVIWAIDAGTYILKATTTDGCIHFSNAVVVNVNRKPIVDAGPDVTLEAPVASVTLNGHATDVDGTIVSYLWEKNFIDDDIQLSGANTTQVLISELPFGTYSFRLSAKDNFGNIGYDNVSITILPPPNNYNHIITTTLQTDRTAQGNIIQETDIDDLTIGEKQVNISYVDGVGRPMQTVDVGVTPSHKDLVSPIAYDAFNRESLKYLPYSELGNGNYKKNALAGDQGGYTASEQYKFYQNTPTVPIDQAPYAETQFEPSPLNRIEKAGGPGVTWQPNSNPAIDHSIKTSYEFNRTGEVFLFSYSSQAGLTFNPALPEYYSENTLTVTRVFDQSDIETVTYTDSEGKVVLKKSEYKKEGSVKYYTETYYVYDDKARLMAVLPPEAMKMIRTANQY